jgi:acetylornithine/N-succinyldiaminopimelate aminotransferase
MTKRKAKEGIGTMETAELMAACQEHIFNTYARFPVVFTHGKACRLWDNDGKEYLDFLAGIAVCNLGHCHPELTNVLCQQAESLVHVSNLFYTVPQVALARELTRLSFADKVFFANSGAEANEAAIKLARKYSRDRRGPGRFHIITMKGSFHGRTMATLSATGQQKVHVGFDPLVEGFTFVDFNSIDAVEAAVTKQTCAVMVEPIQAEGGIRLAAPGYFAELKSLCHQHDLLLIFDEVQVGMGRTGTLFAYEQESVTPDIMTLAKALGNGLPIGAMLATEDVAAAFGPGTHASTFGGTPLVTAVAARVLQIIGEQSFLRRVEDMGAYFKSRLQALQGLHPIIREVRGRGLLLGMELAIPGQDLVKRCLEMGVVINCAQENILRFVPPLVVERKDIDCLLDVLHQVLAEKAL